MNPVLKGFNPDPTMCYAKDSYYIATSTFQFYPGISIYKSKELKEFKLIGNVLTNKLEFNLIGIEDSAGIWAPNLVYNNGIFYLTYTIVKSATGVYYDMDNYITTCRDIENGVWTKPIKITSGIFDPSLYFEEDRLFILGKIVDHRYEPTNKYIDKYSSIIIYEADINTFEAKEDFRVLTHGSDLGGEEGPQLFKKDNYYYLNIAEGGTEYGHQTTLMRSDSIYGEYILHPDNPILKSGNSALLQKAGHSSIVHGHDGWYLSHLCSRVLETKLDGVNTEKFCPLGRETAIQKVMWKDDWPYVLDGPSPCVEYNDYNENLNDNVFTLQNNKWFSVRQDVSEYNFIDNDVLTMEGHDSLMSKFDVNAYFSRVEEFKFNAGAKVLYNPNSYLQASGITLYYDTLNHLSLFVTYEEKFGLCVKVEQLSKSKYSTLNVIPISIPNNEFVNLEFRSDGNYIYGFCNGVDIGIKYNLAYLSDDFMLEHKPLFFTGMLFGVYATDMKTNNLKSKLKNIKILY